MSSPPHPLALDFLDLVVIVVVVQICQFPFLLCSCSVPSAWNILPGASQCLLHLIKKVLAQLSPPQRFPWLLTYFGANFKVDCSSSQASLKINLFYILWSFHYHFNVIFTVSALLVHENRDLIYFLLLNMFTILRTCCSTDICWMNIKIW